MRNSWKPVHVQVTRRVGSKAPVGVALWAALATMLFACSAMLGAQSRTTTATTDPLAEASALFAAREPATTAASALRRTHNRTPAQATVINLAKQLGGKRIVAQQYHC